MLIELCSQRRVFSVDRRSAEQSEQDQPHTSDSSRSARMRRHHHLDNNLLQRPPDQPSYTSASPVDPFPLNPAISSTHHPIHHHVSCCFLRFKAGLLDSLRIGPILNKLQSKYALRTLIVQNSILQLLLIASLITLESYADSRRSLSWSTFHLLFNIFWLFPITIISLVLNSCITESCLNLNHHGSGAPATIVLSLRNISIPSPLQMLSFLKAKLGSDYDRILVLLNYWLMAKGLLYIPWLGFGASFAFCSIANSFYCFDPDWHKDGLSFEERIDRLEAHWDYHLGFGLVMTILTSIYPHHNMMNLSIFTLLFPFLLILSSAQKHRPRHEGKKEETGHARNKSSNPLQLPVFFIARQLYPLFSSLLSPAHAHPSSRFPSHLHGHVHIEDGSFN